MDWCPLAERYNPHPGSGSFVSAPLRGVLHTMEAKVVSPSPNLYSNFSTAPHFTVAYTPANNIWCAQHFPVSQFSKALLHNGPIETNRMGAIQIEIGWMAADAPNIPRPLLDVVKELMQWINNNCDILPQPIDGFHYYPPEDGYRLGQEPWRMSFITWQHFNGWCGHCHVPTNVHGDPGKIDIDYLLTNAPVPGPVPPPLSTINEVTIMPSTAVRVQLDGNGNGWTVLPAGPDHIVISSVEGFITTLDGHTYVGGTANVAQDAGVTKLMVKGGLPNAQQTVWVAQTT